MTNDGYVVAAGTNSVRGVAETGELKLLSPAPLSESVQERVEKLAPHHRLPSMPGNVRAVVGNTVLFPTKCNMVGKGGESTREEPRGGGISGVGGWGASVTQAQYKQKRGRTHNPLIFRHKRLMHANERSLVKLTWGKLYVRILSERSPVPTAEARTAASSRARSWRLTSKTLRETSEEQKGDAGGRRTQPNACM